LFFARFREIGTGSAAIPAADNLELNFGCGRGRARISVQNSVAKIAMAAARAKRILASGFWLPAPPLCTILFLKLRAMNYYNYFTESRSTSSRGDGSTY